MYEIKIHEIVIKKSPLIGDKSHLLIERKKKNYVITALSELAKIKSKIKIKEISVMDI